MNMMNQGMPGVPPVPGTPAPAPAAAAVPPVAGAAPLPPGQAPGQKIFELDMNVIQTKVDQLIADHASKKRESDFFSFKKGENWIRILPPWSQEAAAKGSFAKFHMTHFNLLEKQSCSCWESSLPNMGFVCPICHLRATYGRYMGQEMDNVEPRGYHYANAVIYDTPDMGRSFLYKRLKPFVLRLPSTVWGGLMQMMQHPYIGNITSVDNGWIIRVDKPESFQGKNSYTWGHVMQGPLAPDEATKGQILADIHDLDRFADFGVPTREKLERQFQLAQAVMENCHRATGYAPEQVQCNLQLVIPPIVEQTHGQAAAASVPGMAGSVAPQMAAPAVAPVAGAVPAPQPAGLPTAPAPAPAPQLLTAAPPGVTTPPGQFPGMAATPAAPPAPTPMATVPTAMPPAPAPAVPTMVQPHPGNVPVPTMPAAPAAPPVPAPMPAAGAAPMPQAPMPQAPMPQAPGPAPMPPAPAPMPPAPGAQQPPFPPAPAPQPQEVAPPTSGAGETPAEKPKAGKVRCPGCGKDYSGKRGLTMHLKKSEACRAAADKPPVSVQEAVQTQAAGGEMPPGMAPPNWTGTQPGPFPQT